MSEDLKRSNAPIETVENRKRAFAEDSQERKESSDRSLPTRKGRKTLSRTTQVKRPYSKVSQSPERSPDISSPPRKKRMTIIPRRPAVKRPFSEISDEETTSEVPSPDKKRRRIAVRASSTMGKKIVAPELSAGRTSDLKLKEDTEPEATPKIWIIGSSYILKGRTAANQCYGKNFGLNANVKWFGKGGMGWSGVLPCFYKELAKESSPDILVIHAGGNDLGLRSVKELAATMKKDLMRIHAQFPAMTILYSCMNERKVWQYGKPAKTNQDRKIINTWMKKAAGNFGGEVVDHPLLKHFNDKLFLADGVHFTEEGNNIFLSSIHCALKKILQKRY